jgi:metal-responsive CopG/Arc/MetJ family transcriptional regulator
MATVNFSVPEDVKEAFDKTFKNKNKSAVIADLMRRAVVEAHREKRRAELFRTLTDRRKRRPAASDREIGGARDAVRS